MERDEKVDLYLQQAETVAAAAAGNAEAQYRVARGCVLCPDVYSGRDAAMWLQRAAASCHAKACYHLGRAYRYEDNLFNGIVEKDFEKANSYFKLAFDGFAKQSALGDVNSKVWLASMCRFGYGTTRDDEYAERLVAKAAEEGCTIAKELVAKGGVKNFLELAHV